MSEALSLLCERGESAFKVLNQGIMGYERDAFYQCVTLYHS